MSPTAMTATRLPNKVDPVNNQHGIKTGVDALGDFYGTTSSLVSADSNRVVISQRRFANDTVGTPGAIIQDGKLFANGQWHDLSPANPTTVVMEDGTHVNITSVPTAEGGLISSAVITNTEDGQNFATIINNIGGPGGPDKYDLAGGGKVLDANTPDGTVFVLKPLNEGGQLRATNRAGAAVLAHAADAPAPRPEPQAPIGGGTAPMPPEAPPEGCPASGNHSQHAGSGGSPGYYDPQRGYVHQAPPAYNMQLSYCMPPPPNHLQDNPAFCNDPQTQQFVYQMPEEVTYSVNCAAQTGYNSGMPAWQVEDMTFELMRMIMDGTEDNGCGCRKGKKGASWLEVIAKAFGKMQGAKAAEMVSLSQQMDASATKKAQYIKSSKKTGDDADKNAQAEAAKFQEISNKFMAAQQEFSILANAFSAAIKGLGDACSQQARRN